MCRSEAPTSWSSPAYKPRTSPYSFQGLGEEGLRILARVRTETGLPVVTEATDIDVLDRVVEYADAVQIGARNMQNYTLLKRVGRCARPVLLKRGLTATVTEMLLAAEDNLDQGNRNVVLCECRMSLGSLLCSRSSFGIVSPCSGRSPRPPRPALCAT